MENVVPYLVLLALAFFVARSMIKHPHKPQSSSMGGVFGAFDEVFNPAAQRSRRELQANNEKVIPLPSAGPLDDSRGEITIHLPPPRQSN